MQSNPTSLCNGTFILYKHCFTSSQLLSPFLFIPYSPRSSVKLIPTQTTAPSKAVTFDLSRMSHTVTCMQNLLVKNKRYKFLLSFFFSLVSSRPGFVRLNLPFFFCDDAIEYILAAIEVIASDGWALLPQVGLGFFQFPRFLIT